MDGGRPNDLWTNFIIWRRGLWKPILHLPLVQSWVNTTYLIEFVYLDIDLDTNLKKYKEFVSNHTSKAPTDRFNLADEQKKLETFAEINDKITRQKLLLEGQFLDHKLHESFLEGGPQSILQMTIVFKQGFNGGLQIFTILTSLLGFTLTSTEMYLTSPTKVSNPLSKIKTDKNFKMIPPL